MGGLLGLSDIEEEEEEDRGGGGGGTARWCGEDRESILSQFSGYAALILATRLRREVVSTLTSSAAPLEAWGGREGELCVRRQHTLLDRAKNDRKSEGREEEPTPSLIHPSTQPRTESRAHNREQSTV
jgi:hypothetical protein